MEKVRLLHPTCEDIGNLSKTLILHTVILTLHNYANAFIVWNRAGFKGQLISKGLFDVIVSTKKPTKFF